MKKALLVRLSSLGDVIFNIPLANVLQDNGYEVTWLVSEKGIDVVENNPAVKNAILIPAQKWKKRGFSIKNFFEFLQILHKIRKEKFDVALDTQMRFKSLIWMIFCNAKRKIGNSWGREFSAYGCNEIFELQMAPDFQTHAVFQHMQYAQHLKLEGTDKIKFTLPPSSDETKTKIDELLKDLDKSKPVVVIAPATTWKLKHWDKDNWKAVVNSIQDKCSLIFTGTEKDKELISYIGGDNHLNLSGKTGIKDLIELFSRAKLVIAPDSGSAHLARATNIPAVISIFCCTPKSTYGPFGNDEKYFAIDGNLTCQPCHAKNCPLTDTEAEQCIKHPNPEKVISIVNKVLLNSNHSV